jgi:hypothetical protein
MNDDMVDDIEEICLIVDVSCVDWIMSCIDCISRKLYLNTYSESSLYS